MSTCWFCECVWPGAGIFSCKAAAVLIEVCARQTIIIVVALLALVPVLLAGANQLGQGTHGLTRSRDRRTIGANIQHGATRLL